MHINTKMPMMKPSKSFNYLGGLDFESERLDQYVEEEENDRKWDWDLRNEQSTKMNRKIKEFSENNNELHKVPPPESSSFFPLNLRKRNNIRSISYGTFT